MFCKDIQLDDDFCFAKYVMHIFYLQNIFGLKPRSPYNLTLHLHTHKSKI